MSLKEVVTFKIDGKTVQAQRKTPIIEVASELGIYIPTLCYHPALEPYGACRICSVEIDPYTKALDRCMLRTVVTFWCASWPEAARASPEPSWCH